MKFLKTFEMPHNPEIDEKFHQLNLGNIGSVIYWWKFFEELVGVPGDVVECGVGRGRSLLVISSINHFLSAEEGGNRRIFAYDSFEGFPEPTPEDESFRKPLRGDWSRSPSNKYEYSIEFTEQILSAAGLPLNECDINITKGFFGDSLKDHPDSPIALLHVDGDLYQSYKDVLENLYDRVSKGGIIVFDDFLAEEKSQEKFPGSRLAVKEFFGDSVDQLRTSVGGTNYFVKE